MPVKVFKNVLKFPESKIPTRFDDIQKEIEKERLEAYYNQTKQVSDGKTYSIGSVISEELGKKLNLIG